MIHYQILLGGVIAVEIEDQVTAEEMSGLAVTMEALAEGNPKASINFKLHNGLSIRWIRHVEQLCEDIPNCYTIARKSSMVSS